MDDNRLPKQILRFKDVVKQHLKKKGTDFKQWPKTDLEDFYIVNQASSRCHNHD